jgi:hypothetical protein
MDNELTVTEHDAATGETVVRPMTDAERAQYELDIAEGHEE